MKALAWEDIDMTEGLLKVRYNINRLGHLNPPKTLAGYRNIELLPSAMAVLKRQRELTFMLPARAETLYMRHNKQREEMRRRVFLGRENMPYVRPELFSAPGYWGTAKTSAADTSRTVSAAPQLCLITLDGGSTPSLSGQATWTQRLGDDPYHLCPMDQQRQSGLPERVGGKTGTR